jgi:hypothetical protein
MRQPGLSRSINGFEASHPGFNPEDAPLFIAKSSRGTEDTQIFLKNNLSLIFEHTTPSRTGTLMRWSLSGGAKSAGLTPFFRLSGNLFHHCNKNPVIARLIIFDGIGFGDSGFNALSSFGGDIIPGVPALRE